MMAYVCCGIVVLVVLAFVGFTIQAAGSGSFKSDLNPSGGEVVTETYEWSTIEDPEDDNNTGGNGGNTNE